MKKSILLMIGLSLCIIACKKNETEEGKKDEPKTTIPTLTASISGTSYNLVQIQPTLTSDGGSPLIEQGVCYSTTPNPTVSNNKIQRSVTDFVNINNLPLNVLHYFRYYAINKNGTSYSNEITHTLAYRIGEAFAGGYIFKIDDTKLHGLVVSTEDIGGSYWDTSPGYSFLVANAYSFTDGKENTDKIVAKGGHTGSVAGKARAYKGGGYTDWYLPAVQQLLDLKAQKFSLTRTTFPHQSYWSSTEDASYNVHAYSVSFSTYYGASSELKALSIYGIRAVRAF